ncbi:hypothetical protein ON010_g4318 [Phytophthora cinnamomi]|nr:hypothetical protein ON010_g4318 [Phytophthora cinnamomi]
MSTSDFNDLGRKFGGTSYITIQRAAVMSVYSTPSSPRHGRASHEERRRVRGLPHTRRKQDGAAADLRPQHARQGPRRAQAMRRCVNPARFRRPRRSCGSLSATPPRLQGRPGKLRTPPSSPRPRSWPRPEEAPPHYAYGKDKDSKDDDYGYNKGRDYSARMTVARLIAATQGGGGGGKCTKPTYYDTRLAVIVDAAATETSEREGNKGLSLRSSGARVYLTWCCRQPPPLQVGSALRSEVTL